MKSLAAVFLTAIAVIAGTVAVFILGFAHPLTPGRAAWGQAISWSAIPFAIWAAAVYAVVKVLLPESAGRGMRNVAMAAFAAVPVLAVLRDFVFVMRGDEQLVAVPIILYGTIAAALLAAVLGAAASQ